MFFISLSVAVPEMEDFVIVLMLLSYAEMIPW
jgi:hypothetical protein